MADETKVIEAILGPYRGKRLTVSAADADAAVNDHWAIDPFHVEEPDEEPHPPLSEEERTAALEAAQTWAQAQWDTAQGVQTPKEEGADRTRQEREAEREAERQRQRQAAETRDMTPGDAPGARYERRTAEQQPAPQPQRPTPPRR